MQNNYQTHIQSKNKLIPNKTKQNTTNIKPNTQILTNNNNNEKSREQKRTENK